MLRLSDLIASIRMATACGHSGHPWAHEHGPPDPVAFPVEPPASAEAPANLELLEREPLEALDGDRVAERRARKGASQ
jgi:hypothetical protein